MHAFAVSSRRIRGRFHRAVVALAPICAAPSASATATLTKTFDGSEAGSAAALKLGAAFGMDRRRVLLLEGARAPLVLH